MSQRYRPDNTPFIPHALGQLAKAGLSPVPISLSAEPNITGVPFRGALLAHYTFALPPTATSAYRDANVQYHFVRRPGIAVSVMQPTKHTADVAIFLDESQYVEASAPSCTTKRYTPEQVDDAAGWSRGTLREIALAVPVASPGVLDFLGVLVGIPPGALFPFAAKLAAAINEGVEQTDCTLPDPIQPPIPPSVAGSDNQSIQDMSQPYPVAGWLIMSWESNKVIQLSPQALRAYRAARLAAVFRPR